MTDPMRTAHHLADAISARLAAWRLRPAGVCPDGRLLLACEMRERYLTSVDPARAFFAQENAVMVVLERDSDGAVRWLRDSAAYRRIGGALTVAMFSANPLRAAEINDALLAHPVLDDADRDAVVACEIA